MSEAAAASKAEGADAEELIASDGLNTLNQLLENKDRVSL
jgi:hypothetical protein